MPIFTIEGNIGSGKSTIMNALRVFYPDISNIPVVFVDEPVSQWESIVSDDNKNMIELFYSNPTKYAFSFQMMAYISRLVLLQQAVREHPKSIILTERCLLTDYKIFAQLLYENKSMLAEEYAIYKQWFSHFQKEIIISGIIYIQTDVLVSYKRCMERNRLGETISYDYLEKCDQKHEEWMSNTTYSTLTIDNNDADIQDVVDKISDFIADVIDDHPDYDEPTYTYNTYVYWMFTSLVHFILLMVHFITHWQYSLIDEIYKSEYVDDKCNTTIQAGDTIECRDCNCKFIFTNVEQEYLLQKGLMDAHPSRCKECQKLSDVINKDL